MRRITHNGEESRQVAHLSLRNALKQLPKAQYEAYLYVEILGFTTRETGGILGCSQPAIVQRISSARVILKKIFAHTLSK